MKKSYMSCYGKIVKQCPGLHEYWYHGWMLSRGSGLSSPNPDYAPTEKDWALCKEILEEHKQQLLADGRRHNAPYDQDMFEDMIFDFIGDHAGDGDWPGEEGEYPDVCKTSIDYDEDDNVWAAYAQYASNGVWVEFFGHEDGNVTMEVEE